MAGEPQTHLEASGIAVPGFHPRQPMDPFNHTAEIVVFMIPAVASEPLDPPACWAVKEQFEVSHYHLFFVL